MKKLVILAFALAVASAGICDSFGWAYPTFDPTINYISD